MSYINFQHGWPEISEKFCRTGKYFHFVEELDVITWIPQIEVLRRNHSDAPYGDLRISYLQYIRNFLICVWFVWSGISSGLVHRVSSTAAGPRTNYLWLSSKSSHHRSNGWLGPHGYRLRPGVVGSARHSDSSEHNVLNSALSLQTQIDIDQYCASS